MSKINCKNKKCNNNQENKLHVHHTKPFVIILHEFLMQYSQFSPIEDKETLVRLAMTYKPFWNIDNGITLCKTCHNKKNIHRWSLKFYGILN
jgi:hypothetical protein